MFPTFISILDIQSWWEVPSIAHFCSLFRTAFNLLDFDIEDLEEALLTDGTEESSWLQELIVRLLSGCLPNNEISTFNYQMFLRRLFRQKCQEHDQYNPFNTDIDFQLLPLRTKVDILHALCDFRLDADDVLDQLKNLEADSLRVEPLGYDTNDSAYWYFYGTRLYREDFVTKNNKRKAVWQVICFTEDDWFQLTKKLKKSNNKAERQLHLTLSENFLPELPRLFKEKENLARKRLLENVPRRTSSRLKKLEIDPDKVCPSKEVVKEEKLKKEKDLISQQKEDVKKQKKEIENKRQEAYERRAKLKERSSDEIVEDDESSDEMASTRSKKYKIKEKTSTKEEKPGKSSKKREKPHDAEMNVFPSKSTTVGRQTNNSLSAATGQILIEPVKEPSRKKLKTSQVFRQTDEDLQTGMHKILDFVKGHKDAWPFTDPVEEEYAPNYYSIIRKPMDLQRMEERLDAGYYKSFDKFRGDFQLIIDNCKLYNGAENEYTEMVDNLHQVFDKATVKYLDQISSSDDEIAIEFSTEDEHKKAKKSDEHKQRKSGSNTARRKPMLVAQTDRKRARSESEDSLSSLKSLSEGSPFREVVTRSSKHRKYHHHSPQPPEKQKKSSKSKKGSHNPKKAKSQKDKSNTEIREKSESKKDKSSSKKSKKAIKREKEKEKKKKKIKNISPSPSLSPPPSDSPPPSSPDSRFNFFPKGSSKRKHYEDDDDDSDFEDNTKESHHHSEEPVYFEEESEENDDLEKEVKRDDFTSMSPKPKDKHNKLRETIEKLKAKSEIKLKKEFEFELDHPKENKEKSKKQEKEEKNRSKVKDKSQKIYKPEIELTLESTAAVDSLEPEMAKPKKPVSASSSNVLCKQPPSNMDALSIATEQTLKDINKWLDDTPKFTEFSSASNSPSYTGLDDIDVSDKMDQNQGKKKDKPLAVKKDVNTKDPKKKPFRDPCKFFKKREVQRTIDRLQPGKSKGNLITNVQNTNKADEVFPLGPLSKLKDTKNSLIVKTNTNAPKLSLGSVLDSFGKHKFVDDQKKEVKKTEEVQCDEKPKTQETATGSESSAPIKVEDEIEKTSQEFTITEDTSNGGGSGGATPNLSAWFKAFGAPKIQPVSKKTDTKLEAKDEKTEEKDFRKVPMPLASPNLDQPISRQRRISTGSSVSERSSFSQDMDSPRVGMDERGSYPAPYPSPLHRSPSGASPSMASPRPDISPKATYSTINGQIRVGFYQDTASNKSSPDKSCSPRENSQSPYPHYSEHVYTPNTTENSYYSYTNSPCYTHVPSYSSTNPTPPYNSEGNYSYYDSSKTVNQNYTANSPSSNQSPHQHSSNPDRSPGLNSSGIHPQHSPIMHSQRSPSIHSQHSPSLYSPHSPTVLPQHSPNVIPQNSPVMQTQHPQFIQRSPNVQRAISPEIESFPVQEEPLKSLKGAVFPVKKRAYNESELPQITNQKFEISPRLTQQIELKKNLESQSDKMESKPYVHQNIPDPKNLSAEPIEYNNKPVAVSSPNIDLTTKSFNYEAEATYALNIPARDRSKIDMSKYTNMGYTGPEVNTRALNFPATSLHSMMTQKQIITTQPPLSAPKVSTSEISHMRYGDPNIDLRQIGYKTPTEHSNFGATDATNARTESINDRLSQIRNVASKSMSRSTYSTPSTEVGRNMANLSHLVDRFGGDERMMVGLQNTSSYYADKALTSSHLLTKTTASNTSALPILNQANMAAIQSYNQSIQASSTSLFNRQVDLQNQSMMQNELRSSQQAQMQEKKTKKRKSSKTAPGDTPQQISTNQGFQSYVGLKGNSSLEPSAISLKTSSVVPGSAFNFGPTPASLGLGSGLYTDKDGYPNFLEEFRSAPNYYMAAAAAAHHRSTPENTEKQTRPAHQNSSPQSYPFLGAPQARSTYPIAGPFIPNAQAQLMDTSSPLYQHYLQAGVLNQGLLPPPGAYPPGYHPALSMRQPYDSMNRPPWL